MIERIIKPIINPIQRKILLPLKRAKNWPKLLAKYIRRWIKSILGQKTITKQSYIPIGNYYISKRFIVIIILILVILYFFLFIKPPKFVNKLLNRTTSITMTAQGDTPNFSGDAKLFDSNKQLLYRGPLTNGIYEGNGILYNSEDGSIQYEGKFANGLFDGYGKLYSADGMLLYDGLFSLGVYQGQGVLYNEYQQKLYEGQFATGQFNGLGKQFDEQGNIIAEGTYEQGQLTKGKLYTSSGGLIYDGTLLAGKYEGTGKIYDPSGTLQYEGALKDGTAHGSGRKFDQSGAIIYEGEFLAGHYYGQGKQFFANGSVQYEGEFSNNKRTGAGTLYFDDGVVHYKGQFNSDHYEGNGALYNEQGQLLYNGTFLRNVYNGEGELYNAEGQLEYSGSFRSGALNGLAKWFSDNGQPHYIGLFQYGKADPAYYLQLTLAELEQLLGKPSSFELIPDQPNEPSSNTSLVHTLSVGAEEDSLMNVKDETQDDQTINVDKAIEVVDDAEEVGEVEQTEERITLPGITKIITYKPLGLQFTTRTDDGNLNDMRIEAIQISNKLVVQSLYELLQEQYAKPSADSDPLTLHKQGRTHTYTWNDCIYIVTLSSKNNPQFVTITPVAVD